ncbi:MAG: DNA polymerase III subunit delta [Oscillospiraceae bacterium]|jgi:DNA polymerase-3 subunit delta|nr:DNA polymerase III subunit delta [Oscillospiraceae bacterium]
MAKKQNETTDYSALLKELKRDGAGRLYMLWGEEDYLRESFFEELKKLCLEEGLAEFNHRRFDGAADIRLLAQALDSTPFMGGRTLTELRNFPVNDFKDSDSERLREMFSDLPDWATVVMLLPETYEPDGRRALVKAIKKQGQAIEFTTQPIRAVAGWLRRRFAALGLEISPEDCEKLIFIAGDRMTGLVQEVEKLAAFAENGRVTASDIDALAAHIPEAQAFELTDRLSKRRYDEAAAILAELLASGEHPIKTLAIIGFQMRRLYAARLALDFSLGRDFLIGMYKTSPYAADRLLDSARGFTRAQLAKAVSLCAESDYEMKSSGADDRDILVELLLNLAGKTN